MKFLLGLLFPAVALAGMFGDSDRGGNRLECEAQHEYSLDQTKYTIVRQHGVFLEITRPGDDDPERLALKRVPDFSSGDYREYEIMQYMSVDVDVRRIYIHDKFWDGQLIDDFGVPTHHCTKTSGRH